MTFALLQQAQAQGGAPAWTNFIFIGGMGLLFYFLMIRPQSKARKEMEARLSKLKAGDEVVLGSGLFATIERVDEKDAKILYIKLGSSVVKAKRQAVVALAAENPQD
ncbi:MAG TPA: preprotein translocase subunit YajC [Holophagaceae bacterium]|nr:preprotein translocase subunit YajC [Holophagaceae bacterium]